MAGPISGNRPKPTLHFTADDITEFSDFSIDDVIMIRAKGRITDLRKMALSEKEGEDMQSVDIEVESIHAELPEVSSESKPKDVGKAYQRAEDSEKKED